jgi:hypothetical protein
VVFIICKIEIDDVASFDTYGRCHSARAAKDHISKIGRVGILA